MRPRIALLFISLLLSSLGIGAPYNPHIGTWKIYLVPNSRGLETKYSPDSPVPVPRSQTFQFEPSGADGMKFTADTVEADGRATHVEYTAQFDGKDYPVKGDPNRDTVALTRDKPYIVEGVSKKAGEVTGNFRMVVWGNGLIMEFTSKETRNGKTYENFSVFNKVLK